VTEFPVSSLGQKFVFQVKAHTAFTDFDLSDGVPGLSSAALTLAGVPAAPAAAPSRGTSSGSSLVHVDFAAVTQTNGANITSYIVEIDDGLAGNFSELQGLTIPSLNLSASKTTGVVQGRYYRVRYSAQNEIGAGPVSPVAYILAADVPATVQASQLTAAIVESALRLNWTLPQNGGSEVLEGQIVLRRSDNMTFTEESTHCQLAEDSAAFDNRTCLIPLSALRLDDAASNVY